MFTKVGKEGRERRTRCWPKGQFEETSSLSLTLSHNQKDKVQKGKEKNTVWKCQQKNYFTIIFTFTIRACMPGMLCIYIFSLIPLKRKELLDDVASLRWNVRLSVIFDRPSSGFRDNAYAYHFLSISFHSAITMPFPATILTFNMPLYHLLLYQRSRKKGILLLPFYYTRHTKFITQSGHVPIIASSGLSFFSNALTQDTRIKHGNMRPVNYPSFREFIRKEREGRRRREWKAPSKTCFSD
ncbi:hypothetical protein L873DRAFT_481964 [Choiromyces venosus 120613-1]|uniref:Uncharacterized protein n=1 Tax=Choiromyces venosus 120613-1 TaxID=1336337 RepID=A0A3N4JYG0_9PEZI|nr:hypothetical protein L873DRAFT_481964 [Choiromyces venosus 120613-1]